MSTPMKTSSSSKKNAVLAGGAVLVGAIAFVAWKKLHHPAPAFHPSPMTVSTVPHFGGPAHRSVADAHPMPSPAVHPSVTVEQVPGDASVSAPGVMASPAPVAVAAAPSPAQVQSNIESQNNAYYSMTANLHRSLDAMELEYKIAKIQSKIRKLQDDSSSGSVTLPPAPGNAPAPAPAPAKLAQSLTIPLPAAAPASADALLSVADGSGGRVAVVRVGGMEYTVHDGEWVGGMRVAAIGGRHVLLVGDGQRKDLTLAQ